MYSISVSRSVLPGVDVRALIDAGQEGRLPVLRLGDRVAAGAEHDEARQVLVLGAEPVEEPRAEAGASQAGVAAVHQHQGRLVIRHVGLHRSDDANVVDALADIGEDLADLDAALAVLLEFERRAEGRAGLALGPEILGRQFLARVRVEHRLGVEGVDLRRPTVHEQVDHPLRLRRQGGRLRRQRRAGSRRGGRSGERTGFGQQPAERHRAEAHAGSAEHLTSGHGTVHGA